MKQIFTLLILIFSISTLSAQESLNTSGGKASGSVGSVSYSVGQVVYLTKFNRNVSFVEMEGVQQPYEISTVTGIEEPKGISILLTAYPNPTSNNLTLHISDVTISDFSYQLYDMQGRLLQSKKITGHAVTIKMNTLSPAMYFMKVFRNKVTIKTFKIIKTK